MMITFALALLLASSASAEQPIQVSVCDLTGHPERYHSRTVAIQAKFYLDGGFLYDPDCPSRDHWIAVENSNGSETHLADSLSGELTGVADGVFVGKFLGPNGWGYEHFGTMPTKLQVSEVSALRRVQRPSLPDRDTPAPRLALRQTIEELNEAWKAATLSRDTHQLRQILSLDYIAILPNGEIMAGSQAVEALILPHRKALEAKASEGNAMETFELQARIFSIDLQTAVSSLRVSLGGTGAAAVAEWEYLNIYHRTNSQWRLAFSRFIRADTGREP